LSRRVFAQLKLSIWTDPDFTSLTPDAQLIYITALSHPTVNLAGVLDYVPAKFARLSKGMTAKRVQAAVAELEKARFVVSDDDTGELLVRSAIRSSGAWKKPTTAKSIVTDVAHTFSDPLRLVLREELRRTVADDPAAADTTAAKVLLACADDNSATEGSYTSSYTEPSMGTERERDRERDRDSAPKRATRIPDDFSITEEMKAWASATVPGLDIAWHTSAFIDFWRGASNNASKLDWPGTWRNWMRKEYERGNTGPARQQGQVFDPTNWRL